uniref:Uncharacterized protein n=1 Tax=Arundo donax TaxID=35708 RepID=A0A0A9DZL7_ARUDO
MIICDTSIVNSPQKLDPLSVMIMRVCRCLCITK